MKPIARILAAACLLALCLTLGAPAIAAPISGYCGDNIRWTLSEGVLTLTGSGDMLDYPVSVAAPWHHYAKSITTLIVGEGVTSLGDRAFYGCTGLTSVSLPSTLRRVGRSAFYDCKSLFVIVLPDSVQEIGPYAFRGCRSLVAAALPEKLKSLGEYAFAKAVSLTTLQIPKGIKTVPEGLFCGCRSLALVALPETVEKIDRYAFTDCGAYPAVIQPVSYDSLALFIDKDAGLTEEQVGGTGRSRTLYRVQDGDNLLRIAERQYGNGDLWTAIYEANRSVIGEDPNLIFQGMVLTIPNL